jgi:lysozyme
MKYSLSGAALTERFESCRLTAYQDQVRVWTIGWGHTYLVSRGMMCTQAQADAWLMDDIAASEDDVNANVKVPLTQGQFDALCDFTFNLGRGALNNSTLLKLLNSGDKENAAKEFEKWDHAGGQVVAGLLRRRQADAEEFES